LAAWYRQTALRDTRIVAVVGSEGKSTTTRAVSTALGYDLPTYYQLAFGNAYSSVARRILGTGPSAPWTVIEVGIRRPGQMAEIAQMLRPDVTVVTSIASDHSLLMPTFEMKRAEKAEMVRVLPATGTAVLNGDDPNVRWMAGETAAPAFTFGFNADNDIYADGITLDWPRGMRFKLHACGESREVRIHLLGRHMVYSVLAAIAVALEQGLTLDQALPGLESLPPTPERLQPVRLADGTVLLRDECKGDLEATDAALDLLSEIPARRKGVVLGDMPAPLGDPEQAYEHLGRRVAEIASFAVFYGDTPAVQGYLRGAKHSELPRERVVHVRGSILDAVEAVRQQLEPGDVVLFKGTASLHLARIPLALEGRNVRCDIPECTWGLLCEHCPLLERGWDNV
jgi:UDP-N-acetylmuramoyl-tripeptide--D-alanyl-D-alanine ligase